MKTGVGLFRNQPLLGRIGKQHFIYGNVFSFRLLGQEAGGLVYGKKIGAFINDFRFGIGSLKQGLKDTFCFICTFR